MKNNNNRDEAIVWVVVCLALGTHVFGNWLIKYEEVDFAGALLNELFILGALIAIIFITDNKHLVGIIIFRMVAVFSFYSAIDGYILAKKLHQPSSLPVYIIIFFPAFIYGLVALYIGHNMRTKGD